MKFCTNCGTQNPDNNNFCRACGQKFGTSAVSSQPQPQPRPQPTPTPANYQITFSRPDKLASAFNSYYIKVDGADRYELRSGGSSIKIPMAPGPHSIEISVFSIPNKTKFNFQATSDLTFICRYNTASMMLFPLFATPVKVTDTNGKEYK